MYNIDDIIKSNPFSYKKSNKKKIFNKYFSELDKYHYKNCKDYRKVVDNLGTKIKKDDKLKDFTMIPINLFKIFDLLSVDKGKIVKKVFSSGTSGQNLSKIFLDRINSKNQMKVLSKILENIFGKERLPMIIVDKDPRHNAKLDFNAKTAAILGFSLFGKNHCYILNNKENVDINLLKNFLKKYDSKKFIIFGFTGQIFKYLLKKSNIKYPSFNFKNGILLHGGGWKKLEKFKINNIEFKKKLNKKLKIRKVYNYYGLVEQTGSIFIEGKNCGYLHTSIFSDLLIRDKNFKVLKNNEKGLIQLFSLLPTSYPGHNILTEDIGEIKGEDDCKCGLKGKYFLVHGRIKRSEVRGCSDVR